MASYINITNISGTSPFDVYICAPTGNNCIYVTGITSAPVIIEVPTFYETAESVLVKIIDSENCIDLSIEPCMPSGSESICFVVGRDFGAPQNYTANVSGTKNGKSYYQIYYGTPINDYVGYVYWNDFGNVWEFWSSLTGGTFYGNLDNGINYPVVISISGWTNYSFNYQIFDSYLGVCNTPTPTPTVTRTPYPTPTTAIGGCHIFDLSPPEDTTFTYVDCSGCEISILIYGGEVQSECIQLPYSHPYAIDTGVNCQITPTPTRTPTATPTLTPTPKPFQYIFWCCDGSLIGYWDGFGTIPDGVYGGYLQIDLPTPLTSTDKKEIVNYKTKNSRFSEPIIFEELKNKTTTSTTQNLEFYEDSNTESLLELSFDFFGCFEFITSSIPPPIGLSGYTGFTGYTAFTTCEDCLNNVDEYCPTTTTTLPITTTTTQPVTTTTTTYPYYAYLFIEPFSGRTDLNTWMDLNGSEWRGYNINAPSINATIFEQDYNNYISYTGWGVNFPAIGLSPITNVSGGYDDYGYGIEAYTFFTYEVSPSTVPSDMYAWYTWLVSTGATNGLRYSTIANSPELTERLMNNLYSNFTVNYTGSTNIPADVYRVYSTYGNNAFKIANNGLEIYFRGGSLTP